MSPVLHLRTAAWYGDRTIDLPLPDIWDVNVFWPRTGTPLTEEQIAAALESPRNQLPLRRLCAGRMRPVIIVDDLNRPTPVYQVMPCVLSHFRNAGVPLKNVTIVVASGMHGPITPDGIVKKVGPHAAAECRLVPHDYRNGVIPIGTTSFGTPVSVNKEVAAADFVLGIGGVYPNHTAGFGGGSKLVLGVLGEASITRLHSRHSGVGWGDARASNFRKDLDEIARLLQVRTMLSLFIDADREIVSLYSGDHFSYYPDAVAFCREMYTAPTPDGADVIVSNTYPNDTSLTFAQMKGMTPLHQPGVAGASRIAIGSCSDGLGRHDLFPLTGSRRLRVLKRKAQRVAGMSVNQVIRTIVRRSGRVLSSVGEQRKTSRNPIWLYSPEFSASRLPRTVAGIKLVGSWQEIISAVTQEQGDKQRLKVLVYPCSPLQCLEPQPSNISNSSNAQSSMPLACA